MKNKKMVWVVVVVVVIAAVWWIEGGNKSMVGQNQYGMSPTPTPSATPKSNSVVKKSGSSITSPKTYNQLVNEYAGRIVQFDASCQIIPSAPTFKNGTTIMLDNRSDMVRIISIAGVKYTLDKYGYKVITLTSPKLPKQLSINCDNKVNVGSILLQATILNY